MPARTRPSVDSPSAPIYAQFATTQQPANASTSNLHHPNHHQNFSRPAAKPSGVGSASSPLMRSHTRKHSSATPGLFEPTLPSTSTSNLSQVGLSQTQQQQQQQSSAAGAAMSASQAAAQAAVMSHQQHTRHRSQTVPFSGDTNDGARRGSGSKGPVSPPILSLTEASAPSRDASAFGALGITPSASSSRVDVSHPTHSSAATAAANVVFPRSGNNSPGHPGPTSQQGFPLPPTGGGHMPPPSSMPPPPPPAPPPPPEKPSKSEKARAKLFSRPSRITTKAEVKEKPLPSPGKIGSALSALQRGNFSSTNLADTTGQSLYSHQNSSAATIRPVETAPLTEEKDKGKEKEKRHHFLSRQKHKLKDEFHLPLSSAASNSLPTDPSAPNSLYSFNIPSSPGPGSSGFAKAKKDRKHGHAVHAERSESRLGLSEESSTLGGGGQSEWPGPSSLPSQGTGFMFDPVDPGKLGLHNHMTLDDAWPYLKAKLLVIFEGEDLRLPIEDFNRVVQMHIQYCIQRRSPNTMVEDLRDFLAVGFSSLDRTLRKTPEDRFIPALVELWLFTFTSILPYMQAVFLPVDMEVSGCGTIMTPEQARDFWGGVVVPAPARRPSLPVDEQPRVTPAATVLDVRRLVLTAYRDVIILPRYDTLRTIFSRLSLEFLPSGRSSSPPPPPPDAALFSTSPPESLSSMARPGTAMSLDPSVASYNSTSTTLLGEMGSGFSGLGGLAGGAGITGGGIGGGGGGAGSAGSGGGRSRAISNVSFGSHGSDGHVRPFTPSSAQVLGSVREREQNVQDSKQVTDMVGRMLQCMSVLASLSDVGDDDEGNRKVVELCKMLKLNWLGRGRTGRNRMGIVGGKVRRESNREELRVA